MTALDHTKHKVRISYNSMKPDEIVDMIVEPNTTKEVEKEESQSKNNCATEQDEKFYCQQCKNKVSFGDKFCKNCGHNQYWGVFG